MIHRKKPDWLKIVLPKGQNYIKIRSHRNGKGLATVCEEANCPNLGECWETGTATFMLMGDTCTRGCRFCSVDTAHHPAALDVEEPEKLAVAIRDLQLKYLVLTTVNRDDLPDQGAEHIRRCIEVIHHRIPGLPVEILIPDFCGKTELVDVVVAANPKVLAHNVECVERLTPFVRDPRASYSQSLAILAHVKNQSREILTKSSIMLGLGESESEVLQTMRDLRMVGTDILTIGQYLQPTKQKLPVTQYIPPEKFLFYKEKGMEMGFSYIASGPLVRSSYKASEAFVRELLETS